MSPKTKTVSVLTAAALLRLALLLRPESLWYDEVFSVLTARLPLDRLIAATAGDVHPPLYYLFLKGWLALAPGAPVEVWARAFSVLCGIIALGLWYLALWGMDEIPEQHKRVAFAVAGFMPGLVYYSVEARMYALLAVWVLAAWVLLLDERPLWAGFMLGLACLTHNIGVVYAIALAVVYIWRRREQVAFWMMVAAAGVCWLTYTPWAAIIIRQMSRTGAGYWTWMPTPGTVAYMLFQAQMMARTAPPGLDAALMLLVAGGVSFGLWTARRVVAAWLPVVVVALSVALSYATGTGLLLHRVLTPAVYFLTLGWAFLLTRPDVRLSLTALCILAALYTNALYFFDGRTGAQYDDVLTAIDAQPGDVVLAANFSVVPLTLYDDTPVLIADVSLEGGMGTGLSAQTAQALGLTIADPGSVDWERAWLIWSKIPGVEDRPYVDELIARYDGALVTTWATGGELWLLQR